MANTNQEQKAERFQQLHRTDGMFVIPNSWDAGSAYVYEREGFDCVATSSAGVAYALGYPDGEDITLDDLVQVVRNTVRRVDIPVSADFERGYAFAEAGADCVFVPGPMDEATVRSLVAGIHAPLNTILNGRFHDFAQLKKIGVRRLSVGSGPVRYIAEKVIHAARDIRAGKPEEVLSCGLSYGAANEYFSK
ncbi:MAG: isocitrate lyase/phosphoenolpyruvate mutase family protein [Parafannyhessea sp.]|uniref:isocitrate lyase/phosphoenolpyruvate mutase family protein n=1 Tax=Parafannyhessea sp. TaxID=2847324 RepID=UPI003EFBC0EE